MSAPDFNTLSESERRVVAERLLKIEQSGWKPFWCPDPTCDGSPHPLLDPAQPGPLYVRNPAPDDPRQFSEPDEDGDRYVLDPKWAHNHARVDQRLPPWGDKWTVMMLSGRGSGKTTIGVEFVTLCARKGLDGMIVGRRGTELENTHVATLIARAHPEFVPTYFASKDILVWPEVTLPDGSKKKPVTYLFSAERPENIRSVNTSYAWFDEASWMDEVAKAWANAKFATRVRDPLNPIHFLITSTPTPTPWTMKMEDDPDVEVRRVSTYANRANLSEDFIADLQSEYEGTRLGLQEIHGVVLRDVEGALWNDSMFRHRRVEAEDFEEFLETCDARVIAVDPAGSKGKRSDETGIIGVGAHHTDDAGVRLSSSLFSVLADATIKGSPTEWAAQTFKAARLIRADWIVAEKNFGGEMVKQVLNDYAALNPETTCDENGEPFVIKVVHAVKSKETRAEATVGRYEQGRVTHVLSPTVFGNMAKMEKEQTSWVPKSRGGRSPSPNRVDALVWAVRALDTSVRHASQVATQASVNSLLRRPLTQQPLGSGHPVRLPRR